LICIALGDLEAFCGNKNSENLSIFLAGIGAGNLLHVACRVPSITWGRTGSPHLLFCVICLLYPNGHYSKPRVKYPAGAILRLTAATDTGALVSKSTGMVPCGQEAEDALILSDSTPTWDIPIEDLKCDRMLFARVTVGLRSDDGQATIAKPKATKISTCCNKH